MTSRKILGVTVGMLFLTLVANADTTTPVANCTPYPVIFSNGTGGPTGVSCPAFSVPGATLTGVTLTYYADYQFGPTGTSSGTAVPVVFTPAGPGGVTWSPTSVTLTVMGGQSSGTTTPGTDNAATGITAAAFSSAFTVNISSSVTSGSVATSSGAVTVVYTYTPPKALSLSCPASTGTVGTPYNSGLVAANGVPPYGPYAILTGSLPGGLNFNTATGAITGTPTIDGPFTFTAQVTDSVSSVATTATPGCTITISKLPPPPPTGSCSSSAATLVYPTGAVPENAFLVRYAANLDKGDSYINITNTAINGDPLLGPGFGASVGNLCVNVFTFSPDEQLVSCCSCMLTPNALQSLSYDNDLLKTTLTGLVPTSAVVKLVGSVPGTGAIAGGIAAWGTTLHATPTPNVYGTTETPFKPSTLSAGELASITGRCASILGNGSGFGVCSSCRAGALGAGKLQQ